MGDFNIHYENINTCANVADYVNHVQSVGGMQLIDKPMRISKTCGSIIDNIYTNSAHINRVTTTVFLMIFWTIFPFAQRINANQILHCLPALRTPHNT